MSTKNIIIIIAVMVAIFISMVVVYLMMLETGQERCDKLYDIVRESKNVCLQCSEGREQHECRYARTALKSTVKHYCGGRRGPKAVCDKKFSDCAKDLNKAFDGFKPFIDACSSSKTSIQK